MSCHLRGFLATVVLSLLLVVPAPAQDEMVANPFYKFWANFKPGATAVHIEQSKLSGAEGKGVPGGADEKEIAYKLVEVTKDRVTVEMVVTEQDLLGFVQAAPTRYIYPAKVKKSHLERILSESGAKTGEETMKVAGKEIKCKTLAGTLKVADGEEVEFKLWMSDEVPGTIVKQVRTTRQKGNVVAETTSTLHSHKKPD